MATFLLDTSVIIDTLNNKRGRRELLLQLLGEDHILACCPISVTEVYAGLRPGEEQATDELLQSLQLYPIAWPVAKLAGELKREYRRKGKALNLGDVIIAAVALRNRLTLVTDYTKDFPMPELQRYTLPTG
jgi:predicted nucleic acid-binding protein